MSHSASETLKYPAAIPHCQVASNAPHGEQQMELEQRIRQFEENPELRFTKIWPRSKRPVERDWVNKPYTYEEIQPHIHMHTNYGVLCGHGGLAVPDADSSELEALVESNLPETFTVQTGSGGKHYYYLCPQIQKRLVLERDGKHYGEVQSFGQQVVGPGSIHPNGNRYAVVRDLPIATITQDDLAYAIKPLVRKRKRAEYVLKPIPGSGYVFDINAIPITQIIDVSQYRRAANGELYGPNPWHGSETGMNTWVNEEKNIAYCFRHQAGITIAKAIALNEGIIKQCDDVVSRDGFLRVLRVAEAKYGLRRA